jgi:hypothetical protein
MTRTWGLLMCALLMFGECAPVLNAATRQYQKAVVVSAEKHEPVTPHRSKATDAPDPGTEYDYDISIRLNCSIYVGRYRSSVEYLPAVFAPNQPVEVSLEKQLLYVRDPSSRDIKMSVVRRHQESGDSCKGDH